MKFRIRCREGGGACCVGCVVAHMCGNCMPLGGRHSFVLRLVGRIFARVVSMAPREPPANFPREVRSRDGIPEEEEVPPPGVMPDNIRDAVDSVESVEMSRDEMFPAEEAWEADFFLRALADFVVDVPVGVIPEGGFAERLIPAGAEDDEEIVGPDVEIVDHDSVLSGSVPGESDTPEAHPDDEFLAPLINNLDDFEGDFCGVFSGFLDALVFVEDDSSEDSE